MHLNDAISCLHYVPYAGGYMSADIPFTAGGHQSKKNRRRGWGW